jgi:uncharacterized protein
MEVAGYLATVLIGLSLGLMGGGGSILTVPVLVYLFGVNTMVATSYSLFVVGATSLAGAFTNYRKGQVQIKTALLFGVSSIVTVLLTRRFIIPAIPETLLIISGFTVTKSLATMVLFSLLMVAASFSMILGRKDPPPSAPAPLTVQGFLRLSLYGIGIGLVTGLLGAGGGFLLIPVLVLLMKVPMKEAVGTSLLIIALNSLIGFAGDAGQLPINWTFLLTLTGIAIAGILVGGQLSKYIAGNKLKKGFGWFVLIAGLYILSRELFTN